MAEENVEATAARPEMSDDERAQLAELKAKEAAERKAAAEEEAAEAAEELLRRKEENANRSLFHVLVRHAGRDAKTRTMRAARSGHRRSGVVLDDGKRIRRKGRKRYTPVDLRNFAGNHTRLLEYVRVGQIEVCDPKNEQVIPYGHLVELIQRVGEHLHGDEFVFNELGAQVQSDPVVGADKHIAPPPTGDDTDVTKPDMGQGALLAKVDQHEAEAAGEANTGLLDDDGADAGTEEEEGEGHTEEELLKMGLQELKDLAVETYGCDEEDVSKMRAKKDVVTAIFEAGEAGDEE